MNSPIVRIDPESVHTNIIIISLDPAKLNGRDFIRRMAGVLESDAVTASVKGGSRSDDMARFVTYWEITSEDVDVAIEKFRLVIKEIDEKFCS